MSLFTDKEGGNVKITSPGGIIWEIDAYNENLRIFRYGDGSTDGAIRNIFIEKNGVFHAPFGISGLGYAGSMYGQLGYGAITLYGNVIAYSLVGTVILKISGMIDTRSGESLEDYNSGIDLSRILETLNLNPGLVMVKSSLQIFDANGVLNRHAFGYSGMLSNRAVDGRKILTPSRYYNVSGGTGAFASASNSEAYSPGNAWIAEVVLK